MKLNTLRDKILFAIISLIVLAGCSYFTKQSVDKWYDVKIESFEVTPYGFFNYITGARVKFRIIVNSNTEFIEIEITKRKRAIRGRYPPGPSERIIWKTGKIDLRHPTMTTQLFNGVEDEITMMSPGRYYMTVIATNNYGSYRTQTKIFEVVSIGFK
tara:strand:- start:154 stop:624 length:471 start_codon:yes stop_codon:yes gene_type:complete